MVAAFALPTVAQEWQSTSAFQSTSTMTGSGSSYSSNPTINDNGTASAPSYAPASGPRKIGGLPGTGGGSSMPDTSKAQDNTPIGDAVLPMLLFAAVYMVYSAARVYRRKRRA